MTTRFDTSTGRRLETVLRAVESRRLTGTISVDGDPVHGTVAFRDGRVVGATVAGQPDVEDVFATIDVGDLPVETLRGMVVADVVHHALHTLLALPSGEVARVESPAPTPLVPPASTDEVVAAVARRRVARALHEARRSGVAGQPAAPPPPPPMRSTAPMRSSAPTDVVDRDGVVPPPAVDPHAPLGAGRPGTTMIVQGPLPDGHARPTPPPPPTGDNRAGALRRLIDAVRGG